MELTKTKEQLFLKRVRILFGRGIIVKICLVIILLFIFAAIFAPFFTTYTPTEQFLMNILAGPSKDHLLGTDQLGRDVLTRLLYGARISLFISLLASIGAATIGSILGILAGYIGGVIEQVIMRLTDAHLSIPPLVMSMVLAVLMGGDMLAISVVIAISVISTYIRVSDSLVLSIKENDYIIAVEQIGQKKWKILFKHLLPNCFPPLIVIFTMNLGVAIMIEASLSYLGLGIAPPTPSWGNMVADGYKYLIVNPLVALLPGFCIILIVVSFNIVGDGLRDALDPRLRGKL